MMGGAGRRGFNENEPENDPSVSSRPLIIASHKRTRQVGRLVARSCCILAHLSRPYEWSQMVNGCQNEVICSVKIRGRSK